MNLPGRPVAAFDPEGLIFAAGISSESLKLYDLRSFDKVCFYHYSFAVATWLFAAYFSKNFSSSIAHSI